MPLSGCITSCLKPLPRALLQEVAVEEALEKQEIADRVHTKRATMSAALGIDKKDADELRALVQCVRLHFMLTLTLTRALLLRFARRC